MRIPITVVLCLVPVLARAQISQAPASQAPERVFSVDAAVALAVKQNPRLVAVVEEIRAGRAGARSASAIRNPELVLTPATPGGADSQLLFQQPLELNGARAARAGVANAGLKQAQAAASVELRDLVFETRSAYYELARARARQSLAEEVLRSAREFDRLARIQVELGKRPGIEITQTAIDVARAQQQLVRAGSQVSIAAAALNTAMAIPPTAAVAPLSPLPTGAEPVEPVDGEAALQQALRTRAEITLEEAGAERFRQEARLARAQGLPDLAPQFRIGSLAHGVRDAGIGVGITLPIVDYGSRRSQVLQARYAEQAEVARTAAAQGRIRQEVTQALARLEAAQSILNTFQPGILEQSQRLLEGSRVGLEEGQTSIIAVLQAEQTYRSVMSDYVDAQAELALARAGLERATGSLPSSVLAGGAPLDR